jgi:pimeloyl-ACP methyl ester carboxylesterase
MHHHGRMAKQEANGIEIEYEAFGPADGRPLLLIMGLGGQLLMWDDGFVEMLATRGHRVVRYDNRDVGLSTRFDHAGVPDVAALLQGKGGAVPYTLDDMADDAAALIEGLGWGQAHVVGASMGGMIAQTLAYRHPQRVSTLVSIMSSTGNPALPPARAEAMAILMQTPPSDRAGNIEAAVRTWQVLGGKGFPFDEARIRARAAALFDRAYTPAGTARQLAAILAHGDRSPRLAGVRAPTLVIHGLDDGLVPVEGGRDTAAKIPGAELLEIEGMGHDLPPGVWARLADAISEHVAKAEGRAA